MTADTVTIHVVSPGIHASARNDDFLTPEDLERAGKFRFREDSARWLAFRTALRGILGQELHVHPREVPLVPGEFGKPVLPAPFDSLHFSLSHCEDLALVALCPRGPVGVDLEQLARAQCLLECEATFCHPGEIGMLPTEPQSRGLRLLQIWTAKEALLKALGTGLSHPPEMVRIHSGTPVSSATSDKPLPGIADQRIRQLHHPLLAGYCAAVSAPASITRIEIIPPEASTSGTNPAIIAPRSDNSDG